MSTDGSGQIRTARIRPEYWGEDSRVSDETVKKLGLLLSHIRAVSQLPALSKTPHPARLSSDESNTREESLMGPKMDLVLTTFPDFPLNSIFSVGCGL